MVSRRLVCRSATLLLAPFVVVFVFGGCRASYVDRGATLYAERNYIEADQIFEHNEAQLAEASNAERARYGLYRASTLLSLGDAARAREWLVSATRLARNDPDALSFEERRALSAAWRAHATIVARVAPSASEPARASVSLSSALP